MKLHTLVPLYYQFMMTICYDLLLTTLGSLNFPIPLIYLFSDLISGLLLAL